MWGVYPEAMDWNVGAGHLDFELGECIWTESSKTTQIWHFQKLCPF